MKQSSYLFLSLLLTTSAVSLTTAADLKESPSGRHSGRSAPAPKGKKAVKETAAPAPKGKKEQEEKTPTKVEKKGGAKKALEQAASPNDEKPAKGKVTKKETPVKIGAVSPTKATPAKAKAAKKEEVSNASKDASPVHGAGLVDNLQNWCCSQLAPAVVRKQTTQMVENGPKKALSKTITEHPLENLEEVRDFYDDKSLFPDKITRDNNLGPSINTFIIENETNLEILQGLEGHSLASIEIDGNGDCFFSAVGRDRPDVTNAFNAYINEHHDKYLKAKKLDEALQKYEAFLVSLKDECSKADADERAFQKEKAKASKKSSKKNSAQNEETTDESLLKDWDTKAPKETVIQVINSFFSADKNAAWMPAGLILPIADKLDLNLVIWGITTEVEEKIGKQKSVKEYVSIFGHTGETPDLNGRNILFLHKTPKRAAHFVILVPADTTKFAPTKKFAPAK